MGSPRIIAGKAKGMHLKSVPGNVTRPITDKVKEALFNIIAMEVAGSHFLDLFGGTGSVGIEALSRGAESAVFVEKNRSAFITIKKNLELVGLSENATVLNQDALKFLQKEASSQFDIIFIAPPQYKDIWKNTLSLLDANINWIHPEGLVIVQIDVLEYENAVFNSLEEFDQRRYGDTLLVFYSVNL